VGCRAADVADILVTVGFRAGLMAEEALACGMSPSTVIKVDTNVQAIECLHQLIQSGDIVLVKGSRSMAMEEIVASLQVVAGKR
jgi:UDP-N-acetylmuramoyl-tripeptide--D-alanyl-D-alanine ligase